MRQHLLTSQQTLLQGRQQDQLRDLQQDRQQAMQQATLSARRKLLNVLKQPLSSLTHAQYQIVRIDGRFPSLNHQNAAKIVSSMRIP